MEIDLNYGHDWVMIETDLDDVDGTVTMVFSGRDPTSVTIRLTVTEDMRAIAQSLLVAADTIDAAQ